MNLDKLKAWVKAHKKAFGAMIGAAIVQLTALLALGVLNGNEAHVVAVALVVLSSVGAFIGAKVAPANEVGGLELDMCFIISWAALTFALAFVSPAAFGAFVLVTLAIVLHWRSRRRPSGLVELEREPLDGISPVRPTGGYSFSWDYAEQITPAPLRYALPITQFKPNTLTGATQ